MVVVKEDLKYTKEHEWVKVEGKIATVGITDYAQSELGDILFVDLPPTSASVKQMQTFGTIEAVKAVSDLFAPLSGKVVEVNTSLSSEAGVINKDPYGQGWLIKVEISNTEELNNLLSSQDYNQLIGNK